MRTYTGLMDTHEKKALALTHMLECKSVGELARKIDVGESTIRYWRANDPEFASAWNARLEGIINSSMEYLTEKYPEIAEALVDVALTGEKPSRVGAIRLITDMLKERQQSGTRRMKLTLEI